MFDSLIILPNSLNFIIFIENKSAKTHFKKLIATTNPIINGEYFENKIKEEIQSQLQTNFRDSVGFISFGSQFCPRDKKKIEKFKQDYENIMNTNPKIKYICLNPTSKNHIAFDYYILDIETLVFHCFQITVKKDFYKKRNNAIDFYLLKRPRAKLAEPDSVHNEWSLFLNSILRNSSLYLKEKIYFVINENSKINMLKSQYDSQKVKTKLAIKFFYWSLERTKESIKADFTYESFEEIFKIIVKESEIDFNLNTFQLFFEIIKEELAITKHHKTRNLVKLNQVKKQLQELCENNTAKIIEEINKRQEEYKSYLSSLEYPSFITIDDIKNINNYLGKYNNRLKHEE